MIQAKGLNLDLNAYNRKCDEILKLVETFNKGDDALRMETMEGILETFKNDLKILKDSKDFSNDIFRHLLYPTKLLIPDHPYINIQRKNKQKIFTFILDSLILKNRIDLNNEIYDFTYLLVNNSKEELMEKLDNELIKYENIDKDFIKKKLIRNDMYFSSIKSFNILIGIHEYIFDKLELSKDIHNLEMLIFAIIQHNYNTDSPNFDSVNIAIVKEYLRYRMKAIVLSYAWNIDAKNHSKYLNKTYNYDLEYFIYDLNNIDIVLDNDFNHVNINVSDKPLVEIPFKAY